VEGSAKSQNGGGEKGEQKTVCHHGGKKGTVRLANRKGVGASKRVLVEKRKAGQKIHKEDAGLLPLQGSGLHDAGKAERTLSQRKT